MAHVKENMGSLPLDLGCFFFFLPDKMSIHAVTNDCISFFLSIKYYYIVNMHCLVVFTISFL